MRLFCSGWPAERPLHKRKFIGFKAPFNDHTESDGMCEACQKVMENEP